MCDCEGCLSGGMCLKMMCTRCTQDKFCNNCFQFMKLMLKMQFNSPQNMPKPQPVVNEGF